MLKEQQKQVTPCLAQPTTQRTREHKKEEKSQPKSGVFFVASSSNPTIPSSPRSLNIMSESRSELIAWVNDLLRLNYTKVEQLGTGKERMVLILLLLCLSNNTRSCPVCLAPDCLSHRVKAIPLIRTTWSPWCTHPHGLSSHTPLPPNLSLCATPKSSHKHASRSKSINTKNASSSSH